MTYKGIVRGDSIQMDMRLPYPDGQSVNVQIEPAQQHTTGSPTAILHAVRQPPHLSEEDVDALENAMTSGNLPVIDIELFDRNVGE